jgi:uncharacterized protein (TIGR02145 family)
MNKARGILNVVSLGLVGAILAVLTLPLASNVEAASGSPLKPTAAPSLKISSDKPAPTINLSPNDFGSDRSVVTTTTDNPTGYATTIATNSATETCLRRPSDSVSCSAAAKVINPVVGTISQAGAVNPSPLNSGQWGVSLKTTFSADPSQDNVWFAVPNNANPGVIEARATATPDTGDAQALIIGAKVDTTFPSTATGNGYKNTIVLTATANALAPATITNIATDNPGNDNGVNIGNFATAGLSGGDTLTITGAGLDTAHEVDIDGVAIPTANCGINSATQITCQTPAKTAGDHSVAVKTWGSPNGVTASRKITYVASPSPSITTPTAGQILPPHTTSVSLTATTDVYATCRFGSGNDPTAQMSTTNTSGNAAHQQSINSLTDGQTYTRYVRCNYPNSPAGAVASVTFHVKAATPPTFQPSDGSAIAEGLTPVSVAHENDICHWGTSPTAVNKVSGDNYNVVVGPNTLYYSCVSNDQPPYTTTGHWSFTGKPLDLQSFTPAHCQAMAINQTRKLPDARGGIYEIIRLKMSPDGSNNRCWMRSNLNLENITLTPADSDIAANFTILPVVTAYGENGAPGSSYGVINPGHNTSTADSTYLYNWATAIAYSREHYGGLGVHGDSRDILGAAQYSICPKGWRLPLGNYDPAVNEFALVDIYTYGGTGEFRNKLSDALKWMDDDGFHAVRDGLFRGPFFLEQDWTANFWTGTADSSTGMAFNLNLNLGGDITPLSNEHKDLGLSVRCVLR